MTKKEFIDILKEKSVQLKLKNEAERFASHPEPELKKLHGAAIIDVLNNYKDIFDKLGYTLSEGHRDRAWVVNVVYVKKDNPNISVNFKFPYIGESKTNLLYAEIVSGGEPIPLGGEKVELKKQPDAQQTESFVQEKILKLLDFYPAYF